MALVNRSLAFFFFKVTVTIWKYGIKDKEKEKEKEISRSKKHYKSTHNLYKNLLNHVQEENIRLK